jgi:glycosidase
MDARFPWVLHEAALPYCYYDTSLEKVTLRVVASAEVSRIAALYGDPYDYEKDPETEAYQWIYGEQELYPQYAGAGPQVWRVELDIPFRRRLKYGFKLEAPGGTYYFSENGLVPFSGGAAASPFNQFFFPFIHRIDAPQSPHWVRDTVWYQIFPDRFCRGEPVTPNRALADWDRDEPDHRNSFGGNLWGIRQKLDYLKELGITGIYCTPLFTAPSNHKYDTQDYFCIDPGFGDLEDLKALTEEAHQRGIRVMLDAVFNHAGEQHPYWQDVLQKQENSPYKDYFHIKSFPVKKRYKNYRDLNYDSFAFAGGMPKWNTENPGARRYLLEAAEYWIRECDIDGWRLDVSDEVSLDFWREFSARVRALKKDFYILGEMWHGAANWINPGYFNAVMNYPLGFAVRDYFLRKQTDAEAFSSGLYRALSRYGDLHNRQGFNLLDSHDTPRALSVAGGDKLALRNAFTLLFLLPGSPCIYYGTEIGMTGGADPQCRRPMVWDAAKQDRELQAFFRELIALRQNYRGIINDGVIRLESVRGLPCWEFGGGQERLRAIYSGDLGAGGPPVNLEGLEEELGRRVFSTAPMEQEIIPPGILAVYKKPFK